MLEGVVEQGNRRTRLLWVELDCTNSNPDGVNGRTHRNNAWKPMSRSLLVWTGDRQTSLSVNGDQRGLSRDEWRP